MNACVPGCLYAKSLKAEEPLGEGYRTWFRHADLARYEAKTTALRNQFHWVPDSGRQHPPVVVVEPIPEEGKVLVVRFSDAGKDPFGRTQALRMEAMLVPAADSGQYWHGRFKAEPDKEQACFHVETDETGGCFPVAEGQRLVLGDSRTFTLGKALGGVRSAAGQSEQGKANIRGGIATQPPPPAAPELKTASAKAQKKRLHPFCFLALAVLLFSAAGNAIQYREAGNLRNEVASQREQLEPLLEREQTLSERERQLAEQEKAVKDREARFATWLKEMPNPNAPDHSPPE